MNDKRNVSPQGGKVTSKEPPHNLQAERAVLGACLMDGTGALPLALEALSSGDFYRPIHAQIFEILGRLFIEGVPIDLVTVCNALEKEHMLEKTGGRLYLVSLMEGVTTAANAPYHCRIVKEKSELRQLGELGLKLYNSAYADDGRKTIDIVSQTGERLFALVRGDADSHRRAGRLDFDNYIGKHLGVGGLSWGVEWLDGMTGGMSPGDLVLIEGREKEGKTALATHIARHNAKQGKKILVFSLEMSAVAVTQRIVASETRVPSLHLKTGRLTNEEAFAVGSFEKSEAKRLIFDNLLVDDRPFNKSTLPATIRLYSKEYPLSLIVLDYMTLFSPMEPKEITESARLFKAIAKEYNIPFICLSQRKRPVDGQINPRPRPNDTLGAGIERDCDFLIFVYNRASHLFDLPSSVLDFKQQKELKEWENKIEIILTYDRAGGGRGSFELYFDRNCGWFGDLEKIERGEPSF